MNTWDKSRKIREQVLKLRDEFSTLTVGREYICYFTKYFPEQVTDKKDIQRIKNTWKGITAHEDVLEMLKHIIKELKK